MSIYSQLLQIKRENSQYIASQLEEILSVVYEYNIRAEKQEKEYIRCTELLVLKHLGSPATIHKNYRTLVKKDFLRTFSTADDKRVKFITLTPHALAYLKSLDKLMESLTKKVKKS